MRVPPVMRIYEACSERSESKGHAVDGFTKANMEWVTPKDGALPSVVFLSFVMGERDIC